MRKRKPRIKGQTYTSKLIKEKAAKLKAFLDGINTKTKEIIESNDTVIRYMNAYDQLFEKGIDRLGEEIWRYRPYTGNTIAIKILKNQPVDRVTLKDTGAFYESLRVKVYSDSFEIYSVDVKASDIIEKYGDEILGLTNENLNILTWDYIHPEIINYLRENL